MRVSCSSCLEEAVTSGSKRGTTRFYANQNPLLLSGDAYLQPQYLWCFAPNFHILLNEQHFGQHEDPCITRAQSAFQGEQIIDPRSRILQYQAIDQMDVKRTLHQAGWMAETKLQEESIGTEKDSGHEEYEQNS